MEKTKQPSSFKAILWSVIYFLLAINVCVSFLLVFHSYYYKPIFVSGSSMAPTLNGASNDRVDFGIIDDHEYALKQIKRFQIITTYYPFSDSKDYVEPFVKGGNNVIDKLESSYKIKRVYAFPNETFRFVVDEEKYNLALNVSDQNSYEAQDLAQQAIKFYVKTVGSEEFVEQKIKFKRKIKISTITKYRDYEYTLGEDEYWVMGDNYAASSDCFSKNGPIYYENMVGVLIAIEGTCKIQGNVSTTDDGTKTSYRCLNRKRKVPVFY